MSSSNSSYNTHIHTLKHTYIMSYAKLNYIIGYRLITFTSHPQQYIYQIINSVV